MKHLMYDGFNSVQSKLDDLKYVYDFFVATVDELDIEPIMPPLLLPYYHGDNPTDNGVSAFVLLNGGHFTIHTFSYRECYFADLVYPEYYNTKKLINQFESLFPCQRGTHDVLDRRLANSKPKIDMGTPLQDQVEIDENNDFGPHFFAEVKNISGITLDFLFNVLEELPAAVGMTPIMRPYVLKSTPNDPAYISGIVIIAESHIGIHYDIEREILYIDIFSCEFKMNWNLFKEVLTRYFNQEIVFHFVRRGSKYETQADLSERKIRYDKWLDIVGYK